jgi:CheY-like chemotaxis protein
MTKPRILIVEDEGLIALTLALAAEEMGAVVIGPVASVSDALGLLSDVEIDGAVIDAQLIDRDITPVALQLVERVVPFVVYTGTGLPPELAAIHPDLPVFMKPTRVDCVVEAVLGRIGKVGSAIA